jgi:hypothetical protein
MSKINLKKFSIYEFTLDVGRDENTVPLEVTYKREEERSDLSSVTVKYPDGKSMEIRIDLLVALNEALNEIDPYAFVFADLEEK